MQLSIGQRLIQTQRIGLSLRLTAEQRPAIQQRQLDIRLGLIEALREERYEPRGTCPSCGRKLTALEIIRGFRQDPLDLTTACSGCGRRFEPKVVCTSPVSSVELPFFCKAQTLARLPGLERLPPGEFLRQQPALYRSAVFHHGGLRRAFAAIGRTYPFEEIGGWEQKIRPFLGRLPDTVIAEYVDRAVKVIRALRKKLGIKRFTVAGMREALGVT